MLGGVIQIRSKKKKKKTNQKRSKEFCFEWNILLESYLIVENQHRMIGGKAI